MLAGLSESHTYEQLVQKLETPKIPMSQFNLLMKLNDVVATFLQWAIWPHEMFASLYHDYPDEWSKRILPDRSLIPKFWTAIQNHPILNGHPVKRVAGWFHRCIPISVHGDGVPVTGVGKSWGKMADVFHWTSCLATGSTLDICFYIDLYSNGWRRRVLAPTLTITFRRSYGGV